MLLINEIPRLIVNKVFYSLSNIPNFNYDQIEDQLLLYISGKSGLEKSRVAHIIELKCTLLLHDSDLVIIALIGAVADNTDSSIIHTSLIISIKNRYGKSKAISNL